MQHHFFQTKPTQKNPNTEISHANLQNLLGCQNRFSWPWNKIWVFSHVGVTLKLIEQLKTSPTAASTCLINQIHFSFLTDRLHTSLCQLFGTKQTSSHSPIFNLAPTVSSSSRLRHPNTNRFVWAEPGVVLTKDQRWEWWKINRDRFVCVPQDCAHNVSVWAVNNLMVECECSCGGAVRGGAAAAVWGSWGGALCRYFGRGGWLSAAKLDLFSSSTFPCGSTEQTCRTKASILRPPPSIATPLLPFLPVISLQFLHSNSFQRQV